MISAVDPKEGGEAAPAFRLLARGIEVWPLNRNMRSEMTNELRSLA
jgi:hypothetical protein